MTRRIIEVAIAFVLFAVICTAIFILSPTHQEIQEDGYKREKRRRYSGVVSEKYVNYKNHAEPTLVLINNIGVKSILTMKNDHSNCYDYIEVGDSIWKSLNSYNVNVKRDSIIKVFTLDYGL